MRQDSKGAKYTQLGAAKGVRMGGGHHSQPGNIRDESTLGSAVSRQVLTFWEELIGILSLDS
jgi:hypothetical protein